MSSMQSPPFTLFPRFPPEIQLTILNLCNRNDLVCLSLTSHYFRALVTPLINSKPELEWVDQLGSTPDVPHGCPVDHSSPFYRSNCEGVRGSNVYYNSRMHRGKRHSTAARICFKCGKYPQDHPICKAPFCKKHCLCISCPLFIKLRGFMGERRYCSKCRVFTTRYKKHKGRCMYTALPVPHTYVAVLTNYRYTWRNKGTQGAKQSLDAYQGDFIRTPLVEKMGNMHGRQQRIYTRRKSAAQCKSCVSSSDCVPSGKFRCHTKTIPYPFEVTFWRHKSLNSLLNAPGLGNHREKDKQPK